MISKNDLPTCPVATTVGLIGNKWKILLLRDLLTGTKRYSDFQKSLPQISQKILTQNLKSMVNDGIVIRIAYPEVPPRVEYSLSPLGASLKPMIKSMEIWGTDYLNTYKKHD